MPGLCRGVASRCDQIEQVIRRLKASPATRRATAVTWIPPVDAAKDEVPCMIVDDFKLRDGRLHLSIFFRSHDFAGAYPANLYGLARLLEYVAGRGRRRAGLDLHHQRLGAHLRARLGLGGEDAPGTRDGEQNAELRIS